MLRVSSSSLSSYESISHPARAIVALSFAASLLAASCSQDSLRNSADKLDTGTGRDVSGASLVGFFTGQVQQGQVPSDGTNPEGPALVVVTASNPQLNAGELLRVDVGFSDAQADLSTVNFGIAGQPTHNVLSVESVGAQPSGTIILDFTPRSYDPGDYTLVISVTDKAGHTSTSTTVSFTILSPDAAAHGNQDASVPADAPDAAGPLDDSGTNDLLSAGGGFDAVPDTREVDVSTNKPSLVASVAIVSVGAVDIGKTSFPATVTFTNIGSVAGALTVIPAGSGIAATGCSGSLAAGQSCVLSITASPTSAGPITGSVAVAVANGNTLTIGLTGSASQPGSLANLALSPTQISLGDVPVGATLQFSVTVTAQSALTGLTVGLQGADLKLDATSSCTAALAAGASCTIVVNFSSAVPGSPTSDAVVVSQGGVTRSVPVAANVLAPPKLVATPTTGSLVAAPGGSSSPLDINVGNIGGLTTGQLGVALAGANAADFKIVSDTCSSATLLASKFCTVTVILSPASTPTAAETATLTITDQGPYASAVTVNLSSTPRPPAGLTITGGPDLGSVSPGASGAEVLFTVSNPSVTPSGGLTASVNNENVTISTNSCSTVTSLGLNETCTVGLMLTPAATAAPQAIASLLTVASASSKANVVVTGAIVGADPLSVTPSSINFGVVSVGQTSAVQTIAVRNVGATATGPLSVVVSGTGAAQLAITSNTCTAPLAAASTCIVAVRFSPTDTNGITGIVTVSDGSTAITIPVVGSGA